MNFGTAKEIPQMQVFVGFLVINASHVRNALYFCHCGGIYASAKYPIAFTILLLGKTRTRLLRLYQT